MSDQFRHFDSFFTLASLGKQDLEKFNRFDLALQAIIRSHLVNATDVNLEEIYYPKTQALICYSRLFENPETVLADFIKTKEYSLLDPYQIKDLISCTKALRVAQAAIAIRQAEIAFLKANQALIHFKQTSNQSKDYLHLQVALNKLEVTKKRYQHLMVSKESVILVPLKTIDFLIKQILEVMANNLMLANTSKNAMIEQPNSSQSTPSILSATAKKKSKKKKKVKAKPTSAVSMANNALSTSQQTIETILSQTAISIALEPILKIQRPIFNKSAVLQIIQAAYYSDEIVPHEQRKLRRSCSSNSFFEPCVRRLNRDNTFVQLSIKQSKEDYPALRKVIIQKLPSVVRRFLCDS